MVKSAASTPQEYLDELPPDRREAIEAVRSTILANLPEGFVETMRYGMLSYEVAPDRRPVGTTNSLALAALASQKQHMALYLTGVYDDPEALTRFKEQYRATGRKLDMGRSCVRFRSLGDLPLDVVGDVIAEGSVDAMLAALESG